MLFLKIDQLYFQVAEGERFCVFWRGYSEKKWESRTFENRKSNFVSPHQERLSVRSTFCNIQHFISDNQYSFLNLCSKCWIPVKLWLMTFYWTLLFSPEGWSGEGCHVVRSKSSSGQTECSCNHMTHFAVLFGNNLKVTIRVVSV